MRIACVDFDQVQLHIYTHALLGHTLYPYKDSEKFLTDAPNLNLDAVVMGLVMPYKTGCEVCKDLKENPETKDIPVLFVSNLRGDEFNILAETCGAVGHYNKNELNKLREVIDQWH